MPEPITPTRVIPAGAPLPRRAPAPQPAAAAPPPPPRPPRPPATATAPQPAPPAAAGPVVHHVHHHVLLVPAEPEQPRRSWAWLTSRLHPWITLGAAFATLVPLNSDGTSCVSAWAHTLTEARDFGIAGAYVLAGSAITLAAVAEHTAHTRGRQLVARALLVVALLGGTGAINLYDPITALTGVPS